MQRSVLLRLNDILRAIDGASDTIAGIDFETFRSVYQMGRTVERCIEIVSEATRHLPDEIKSRYPDIPWQQVAGIGNVLRHDYDIVDDYIIWDVATVHFPRLRAVISEVRSQWSEN
ncbi:MAG: DUF86 domain-containing protein [Bradyrhizobiaceae bacterium]|nr:DUF86 domain-containing protein [Bradyrhizobiaceae bacterium]